MFQFAVIATLYALPTYIYKIETSLVLAGHRLYLDQFALGKFATTGFNSCGIIFSTRSVPDRWYALHI